MLSLAPRTVFKWSKKKQYEQRKQKKTSSVIDPYKSAIRKEFELTQSTAVNMRWYSVKGEELMQFLQAL